MNFQDALKLSNENPEKVFWFKHTDSGEYSIYILITNKQFIIHKKNVCNVVVDNNFIWAFGSEVFSENCWHEDNTKKLPEHLVGA